MAKPKPEKSEEEQVQNYAEQKEAVEQSQKAIKAIKGKAVFSALGYLGREHGLSLEPKDLKNYVNEDKVDEQIYNITHSKEFQNLDGREQGQFLYEELTKQIIEYKPFDEKGHKLLEGSLEAMVGGVPKNRSLFGRRKKTSEAQKKFIEGYYKDQEVAEGLIKMIAKDPKHYASISPEMTESAVELQTGYKMASLGDTLYAAGKTTKEIYGKVKQKVQYHTDRIIGMAQKHLEDYVATPAVAGLFGIIGLFIVILHGMTITGGIIGTDLNFSIGFLVGCACLVLSGLLFFGRRK
jgi:hypothetical protein